MVEDHVAKIRKGCTLEEMTKIAIPSARFDPIRKQLMPNFHYSSKKTITQCPSRSSYMNENHQITEAKLIPSNHYIENRFYAYSKAMIANKPLFSKREKFSDEGLEDLSNRSQTSSRFRTSKFPNAPLGKEIIEKVENINSFYVLAKRKQKKGLEKVVRTVSTSRKLVKSSLFASNMQSWQKIKREKTGKVAIFQTKSDAQVKKSSEGPEETISQFKTRPKSENRYFRSNKKVEMVSTIESLSSLVSPLAPNYAPGKMVPQSPNLLLFPYTKYGHLY